MSLITAGPGIIVALLVFTIIFAELRVAPLFSGDWIGGYTTWIYSAPFRIREGDSLSPAELRRRLARLDYKSTDGAPSTSGTYREKDGSFEVNLRGFSHPSVSATPGRVKIALEREKVRSLTHVDRGAPERQAVLESELIYEFSGAERIRREPLRMREIPPWMPRALVAIEDRRFYQHPGVDVRGIARATKRNIRERRVSEGGSTLTQQLARTLFLSQKRTFSRKIFEALIAIYMERRFSKEHLIRMYLDSVYFGQKGPISIMGLKAAARHFFDKQPQDLTLGECALLAGILQSPHRFNPFSNPDAALARRRMVLDAMVRQRFITPAQSVEVSSQAPHITLAGQVEPREADFFVAYIQRLWDKYYGDERLLTQGLKIFTTLDPWLQEQAHQAVQKAPHEAALVALNPRTGAIRALVGGKDFIRSPFDRATQALRQPGSAFKPFAYGAALEDSSRWKPDTLILDTRRRFRTSGGIWSPKNYDGRYRGPVPLRTALALSLNAATARLVHELGPEKVIEYARRLGIKSRLDPELGIGLGVFEVTLIEICGAYCAFANKGLRVEPFAVEAVLDAQGKILNRHDAQPERAIKPEAANTMTSLLKTVVNTGTARRLKRWGLAHLVAGKTGTTDGGKDAWFIGYTPDILAGVWVGTDIPEKLGLSGAGAALPVWAHFVRSAYAIEPSPDTSKEQAEEFVTVWIDPAAGLLARSGCPQRQRKRFTAGTEPTTYCTLHRGGISGWLRRMFGRKGKPEPDADNTEKPANRL